MNKIFKLIIIALMAFIILSCNSKTKKDNLSIDSENFDWLLGKWERLNEEKGKETFENWDKISSREYSGIGFTMQNGDTIKQEKIFIIKQNGNWKLLVKVPEETESITFPIIEVKKNGFTCKNDSLDFPKMIKYWKDSEKLKALVAGGEIEIPFEFKRIE